MKTKLTSLAMGLLLAAAAQAQTLDFTSTSMIGQTPNGTGLKLSNGADMPNTLTWDLGYFGGGFTPTASNYADWNTNWISLTYPGAQYSFDAGPDHQVSLHIDDTGTAAQNQDFWMWAYSDKTAMGTPGTEALLFRGSDWVVPPSNIVQMTQDIDDAPGDAADDTFDVVWGAVDRRIYEAGGVLTGGGVISAPVADSNSPDYSSVTFEAQTATWATPVPEPSVLLTSLLGLLGLFGRRRRA